MTGDSFRALLLDLLLEHAREELWRVLALQEDRNDHFSVLLPVFAFTSTRCSEHHAAMLEALYDQPRTFFAELEEQAANHGLLQEAQQQLLALLQKDGHPTQGLSIKTRMHLHVRFHVPVWSPSVMLSPSISKVGPMHLGKLVGGCFVVQT